MRGGVCARRLSGTNEKRASEVPPEFSARAFFQFSRSWLYSVDFPPEIRSETFGRTRLRVAFRSAVASRNEVRMSQIRDNKRKLMVNFRPGGLKIGRARVFVWRTRHSAHGRRIFRRMKRLLAEVLSTVSRARKEAEVLVRMVAEVQAVRVPEVSAAQVMSVAARFFGADRAR